MPDFNFHQHSIFSDGHNHPSAYAEAAINKGLKAIGFTEHSPLPFDNPFSLKAEKVDEYINAIDSLKSAYTGKLEIYRGLEMDYIQKMSEDFSYWKTACKTDYLIGSVHLVWVEEAQKLWFTDGPDPSVFDKGLNELFGGDIKKAVGAFYNQTNLMIESQEFDIIGHFDKIKMHNADRYFTEDEKWYKNHIDQTLELIKQKNLIVEINTRGIYKKRSPHLFPDGYALKRVKEMNIPIIISSDAHKPEEVDLLLNETASTLKLMGFKTMMKFDGKKWNETSLN